MGVNYHLLICLAAVGWTGICTSSRGALHFSSQARPRGHTTHVHRRFTSDRAPVPSYAAPNSCQIRKIKSPRAEPRVRCAHLQPCSLWISRTRRTTVRCMHGWIWGLGHEVLHDLDSGPYAGGKGEILHAKNKNKNNISRKERKAQEKERKSGHHAPRCRGKPSRPANQEHYDNMSRDKRETRCKPTDVMCVLTGRDEPSRARPLAAV